MKRNFTRIIAFFLVIVTILMALPITASATSSSSRCRHNRTRKTTYETIYEVASSAEHIKIKHRKEVCRSCDEILDTWTEENENSHDFDDGICEDCGYQRTLKDIINNENIIVLQDGQTFVKVQGNDEYWDYPPIIIEDRTMVPLTIAVEYLGGEYLYWDNDTSSAYVELDGDTIEFQKNSTSYWVNNGRKREANVKAQIINGKLYVELKVLVRRASKSLKYHQGYIIISENDISDDEIENVIGYLYEGKTYDNESNFDNIKAGKVYATSADGKHIYKRTYDANKSCKYSDVYVCTLFNIDLAPNSVLIQDGNYLYDNGEKAYADVATLQQADKRISQLNRICDGANNAHDAGVISWTRRNTIRNTTQAIIEEYEAVAWGKKALNQVSEVTDSYTAKVGDKNNIVKTAQEKLLTLGFTSQHADGNYDEITFNNVAYLQIVKGLVVTGWVDEATYKVLMNSKTDISEEIESMQKQPNTLPLSKTDIEKGVKVVTVGANQYYDCTEVLNEVFVNAAKEARQHQLLYPNLLTSCITGPTGTIIDLSVKAKIDAENLAWFISKVDNFAEWDIKREKSWGVTVGTTFPRDNKMVMFFGKLYTVSELGNMLYGYAGTAMNIPEEILYMGGGYAITKNLEFLILDEYGDGEDRPLIKEGIEWYKREY